MNLIAFSCRHRGIFAGFAMLLMALVAAVPLAMAAESPVAVATVPTYGNDPAHGATAAIHGTTIYYEIYGKGEPLLLLHGNGQSIAALDKQIAFFSRRWRVIVVDSRGHGNSGWGKGRLTYDQMAEDMSTLLESLGIESANVVGWSDGGNVGLILAIRHPAQVTRLATMGALITPDGAYQWAQDWVGKQVVSAQARIDAGDKTRPWPHYLQLLDLLGKQPQVAVSELKKITAPTLIMAADKDVIRPDHSQLIFEAIPKAQLVIFPGATHFIPAENPAMFNQTVETFLTAPFARPDTRDLFR
jgi:pimeloyl-ACP methyl ester carboxylesterase